MARDPGIVLHVDLATGKARRSPLTPEARPRYVGGAGLAVRLLADATPGALVVAAGPLAGAHPGLLPKYALAAKSPLTGFLGDSIGSGPLAVELRRLGLDAVVLTRRCDRPTALLIGPDGVQRRDAAPVWGRSAAEVEAWIGEPWAAAAIGPASERLVRFACVSHRGRHAGRAGLGAVFGAKNLKAVALRGDREIPVANAARLAGLVARLTPRRTPTADKLAAAPARNFRDSGAGGLAERLRDMEYEPAFALGPLVGNDDPDLVRRAVDRCNALGLDVVSAGGTIAWALESVERGLLPPLQGNLLDWLDVIARREGIGDLLAEGSRRAADRVGHGSHEWAIHGKGLELPGYDPRRLPALAVGMAVGARGACHNRAGGSDAGENPIEAEDRAALLDSLILDKALRHGFEDSFAQAAELLDAAAGWGLTADDLRRAGQRTVHLRKLYNIREGWTPADDRLPERVQPPGLDAAVREHYCARGWTEDGRVPGEIAREFSLEEPAWRP